MKIPSQFSLMGITWAVRVVPDEEWHDPSTVGICSFERSEVLLKGRAKAADLEQTLMHEYVHAALEAMHSKLYDNEDFVDVLAGLLHQILTTAE